MPGKRSFIEHEKDKMWCTTGIYLGSYRFSPTIGLARRDESNDMCLEAGRRFLPEIASAHAHSFATHIDHSIRLDELNQNPSTAHRLVEISSRYRRFFLRMRSCPIRAQSMQSSRIVVQLVETNRMRCVSSLGDASSPRYLRFTSAHARQLPIAQLRHAQKLNEDISGTKRRPATRHVSFDSSRRAAPQSANSALIGFELCNRACTEVKRRYLKEISTNLCADDGFWFSSSR